MAKDKDYIRMIHSLRWLYLRRDILTQHPLCEMCEKESVIRPATEVHHHTPVEYGMNLAEKQRLMFNPANLRALCHECHVKVHTEMGRSGKVATKRKVVAQVQSFKEKYFNDG